MATGKYKEFSTRLIDAMKSKGYVATRSSSGICVEMLSQFAGASEQICRRYVRGDALPDYEKIKNIAKYLGVSPGWLLFGEDCTPVIEKIDDDLLHYILKMSHQIYQEEVGDTNDYADFVLGLIRQVREIDTSKENLHKIIKLAIGSISFIEEKYQKKIM
ncbi:helix-turn-helix domain-containing protein [Legionella sp. CNM-4043-24]|uniref:helix-turn-helix domain-containing protein n=1 Tax=Legionella sp. CNM-4043-24 TaxID=3421646 RepID=UPI00403A82EA